MSLGKTWQIFTWAESTYSFVPKLVWFIHVNLSFRFLNLFMSLKMSVFLFGCGFTDFQVFMRSLQVHFLKLSKACKLVKVLLMVWSRYSSSLLVSNFKEDCLKGLPFWIFYFDWLMYLNCAMFLIDDKMNWTLSPSLHEMALSMYLHTEI